VATILGSPPELIGRSIAEQRFLDVKIGTRVLAPGENSRILTRNALNGVSRVFRINTAPPSSLTSRVGWIYHPASGQIWAGLYPDPVDLATIGSEGNTGGS